MYLTTRFITGIVIFVLMLFSLTAMVYQQSHKALQDRVEHDGMLVANFISNNLHNNFTFIEEDMKLFLISSMSDVPPHAQSLKNIFTNKLLQRRFIRFFETEYGYRIYEKVMVFDNKGNIISSTDEAIDETSQKFWWQKSLTDKKGLTLVQDLQGQQKLSISIKIHNSKKEVVGVMQAVCSVASLVRGGGMNLKNMNARQIDLLTQEGTILYSTALHTPFMQFPDHLLLEKILQGERTFVRTNANGIKELIIALPHSHLSSEHFTKILLLYLDYNTLFQPVLQLRLWIWAGAFALILIAGIFFILVRNITIQEANASALIKNEKILQSILTGIEALVIFVDKETHTITWANSMSNELLGIPAEEMIGEKCYKYICHCEQGRQKNECPADNKKTLHTEFSLQKRNKTIIPIMKTVLNAQIEDRPHYIAIIFDITHRKSVERQLLQAQKLESVGNLAAGIAHEINTPSQYISENLRFINTAMKSLVHFYDIFQQTSLKGTQPSHSTLVKQLEAHGKDADMDYLLEEVPQALSQSLEGIQNITDIVQAMKRFAHPGNREKLMADINDSLKKTSVVCRNEWKYHAKLVYDLDENLPMVECRINDINQVFLNLIVNAAHAVSAKHKETEEKGSIILTTFQQRDNVFIVVSDTGMGIPNSLLNRIFDPFFTTKEVGAGTGQGLAISYSIIVDGHDGTITVESDEGIGTQFTIRLPIKTQGDSDG
nr:ATP-binding protein [uncultured Pseudodesulfovibrio sp.]